MRTQYSVGDVVDGKFKLKNKEGSGGFSTVWRAKRLDDGDEIAVKLPSTDSHDEDTVREQFKNETNLLSSFRSGMVASGIIKPVSVSMRPAYVATEYIYGPNLYEAVNMSDINPGSKEALTVGYEVIRSVSFLHLNNIIHLDITPRNVLLRNGEPVLIDYNTAADASEGCDTVFYSDPFLSPEQIPSTRDIGKSGTYSDVYSCGKLLYFLATGDEVDASETPSNGLRITEYTDWPSQISDIIEKATKKSPQSRYDDCVSMLRKISKVVTDTPEQALITHIGTNISGILCHGDTVGRMSLSSDAEPTYSIYDPDGYVSPTHALFEFDEGDWVVEDKSKNGTYLHTDADSVYIVSERGRRELEKRGNLQKETDPVHRCRLPDSAKVSPVDKSLNYTLKFNQSSM
jgi:serine/threonine protein kinase